MNSIFNQGRISFLRAFLYGVIAIFVVMQVGCVTTNPLDMSPVATTEGANHHPGKIVWHDLLTSDIVGAQDFYGSLFGWSFKQRQRYTVIMHGDQPIGGMIEIHETHGEQHVARWLSSMSVTDVDIAVKLILQQGGKVHEGPTEMKNRGRVAFVSDPQGAQLVVIRSKNGDPEDVPIDLNSWLWDELWTDNAQASADFYQNLAAYTSVDQLDDYWMLKARDRWRVGIRPLFNKGLEQRWVPTVRVNNPTETVKLAIELGGRVIINADDNEHVALLADPSGALFMVQKWLGKDEIEGHKEK